MAACIVLLQTLLVDTIRYSAHYITVVHHWTTGLPLDYCTHITLHIAIVLLGATALYGANVCCGSLHAHCRVVYGIVRFL